MKSLSKYWTLALFVTTFLVFCYLRLVNIDKIPVFVDEAIYVRWSQVMKNEATLRFLPQTDGKQPLFMWLTIPMFKIFSDPLIAGRSLSTISGLGTLVGTSLLTFLLSKKLVTSLLAASLYAVSPFTVFFDRMALVDSLLCMFGVWSLVLGLLFVRTKRLDMAMLLGFAIGGGLLTKSPAIFFYLWQPILALYYHLEHRSYQKYDYLKIIGGWLVAFVISQAMFNILRLGPAFHMINSRNQDYLFSFSEVLHHPLNPFRGNLLTSINWLWLLLTPPILIFVLISPWLYKAKTTLALMAIAFLPLVIQASIAKVYTSRYILFITPALFVTAALSASNIPKRFNVILITLIFTWPLLLSLGYIYIPEKSPMSRDMRSGYFEEWTAGTGQKQVAKYLINESAKGKRIVIGTEGYFGTLPDGLQIYTEGIRNIIIIGIGQPVRSIPTALLNTSSENDIYLLLNKSRNLLDDSSLHKLRLINEYPKAARPDGTREALQLYTLL